MRYIIFFLILLFFSCKNQGKSVSIDKETRITKDSIAEKKADFKKKSNKIDFSFVKNIEPINLPIGNENLKDFDFPESWNFGDSYDSNREISSIEKKIISLTEYVSYIPSKTAKQYQSRVNKYYKKNNDYRYFLFDFKQFNSYDITRYTNLNDSIKILTVGYNKEGIMPNTEISIDVSFRDLIVIKNNKVSSELNIDNFTGNSTLGGHYRKCYIDASYIIHIKDFDYGENQGYFIRYEKWKINNNGRVVRYFKHKDTVLEQGKIKNHLREGNWKEINPDANLALKKEILNIELILSYSEGNYKEGEKVGLWEYYSNNKMKKGKLLYTETYRNGELIRRKFVD